MLTTCAVQAQASPVTFVHGAAGAHSERSLAVKEPSAMLEVPVHRLVQWEVSGCTWVGSNSGLGLQRGDTQGMQP